MRERIDTHEPFLLVSGLASAPAQRGRGTARKGGGGGVAQATLDYPKDRIGYFIDPSTDVAGRNPQFRHAAHLQPQVTLRVLARSVGQVVTYAVDLNGEPRTRTIEIKHIGSDWMLAPKYR
jgi:hypothetical protein